MEKYKLVVSFLIASLVIFFYSSNVNFENLALGNETTTYYAKSQNKKIHFSDLEILEKEFINDKELILFLGNSQTHSINQIKDNEVNYIEIIKNKTNKNILGFTLANGNMMEFYISLLYLNKKYKIKKVFLPIFFDDFRENQIRSNISTFHKFKLQNHNTEILSFPKFINDNIFLDNNENYEMNESDYITFQDISESKLENYLNYLQVWNKRENIRGQIFNFLYRLRNTVFFITPSTKRLKIPIAYKNNLESFKLINQLCSKNNIELIGYTPPIRSDVEIPYDLNQYKNFKNDIKSILFDNSLSKFIELDTIVPGYEWGFKNSTNLLNKKGLDFMHFNFNGHKILSEFLLKYIE